MQKYFIPKEKLKLGIIDTSDAFHITSVMRCRIDDEILVSDCENTYRCKITSLKNDLVTLKYCIKKSAIRNCRFLFLYFKAILREIKWKKSLNMALN